MTGSRCVAVVWLMLCLPCLTRLAAAEEPAAKTPVAVSPAQVRQAVERSIPYLQTECSTWLKARICAACHHVSISLWALNDAGQQGYAIDDAYLNDTFESLLGSREKLVASKIFPDPAAPPLTCTDSASRCGTGR